jgi:hypothetical protein
MIDLDAIEARCNAATKGPWEAKCSYHDYPYIVAHGWELGCGEDFARMPDADFIAHARTDLPALLTEVRRLRARNEELEAIVRELGETPLRVDDAYFGHMAAVSVELVAQAGHGSRIVGKRRGA